MNYDAVFDCYVKGQHTLFDQVGSLRTVVNTSGTVIKQIEYDSFGNVIGETNQTLNIPFGFAGGLYDRDTGLVRFGYRDYAPDTGRWTAKDPIGFAGGDTDLYGYVLSDPINRVDIWGLETVVITTYDYGIGSHSAVYVSTPGSEPYLYDPAGSYSPGDVPRGSGGSFVGEDANLQKYKDYQKSTGSSVDTVTLPTTPEQEGVIKKRAEEIGDQRGFSCAASVSSALEGIYGIEPTRFPGNLRNKAKNATSK